MYFKTAANILLSFCLAFILLLITTGCNSTRHLKEGQYLLKSNSIKLKSNEFLTRKSELTENLSRLTVQKPNSYFLIPGLTTKLWLYNLRYDKYEKDSTNFQLESRTVEKPVIYDSTANSRSIQFMQSYLFQQGYFYAEVEDTTRFKKKKAYVTYNVNTGINYLIRRVYFNDIDDSTIKKHVARSFSETYFRGGKAYSADLAEKERARIVKLLRDYGYYSFSVENISFVLDTLKKDYMKDVESPFESAVNFISLQKDLQKPTLDISIVIKNSKDSTAFTRYAINNISVYPDFEGKEDFDDKHLIEKTYEGTKFRYHDYYLREKVIFNHIFILKDGYFAQSDYDKTINELNQLGVFEYVRLVYFEDSSRKDGARWLNCVILMSPAKKYDVNTNWEVSNGTTYTLGTALTQSLTNKNLARGANYLTISATGGLESQVDTAGNWRLLSKTLGGNVSLEFPKFLFPITRKRYSIRNTPRTELAAGINLFDRVNFFTLTSVSSRLTYKWRETKTKNWEVTPAFTTVIRYDIKPDFKTRIESNDFYKKTYTNTFIEGENIAWTFSNADQVGKFDDYSYVKLSLEEAGGLMSGINALAKSINYSQYVKLDFDLRHFFRQRHSSMVYRFYGGIGMPYNNSSALPYLKQYFVGGAYSLRGWRIRSLGPGSYVDTTQSNTFIDRTGDIKLELNAEYRFDLLKAFGGAMMFTGALFGDAGNIWLFNKSQASFPGGEFAFNKLYTDAAVDVGAGIRVNIASIFLLRLDWAFPVKNPGNTYYANINYKPGWQFENIAFGRSDWRSKNITWNIAIGYPF